MFVFIQTSILVCLSFQHRFLFCNWIFFIYIFLCVDDYIHKKKKNMNVSLKKFCWSSGSGFFSSLCAFKSTQYTLYSYEKLTSSQVWKNYLAGIQSYNLGQGRAGQGIFSHRKAIFNCVGLNLTEIGKYIVLFCRTSQGFK